MALEKHLPRGSRAVDMKKNFPEMFLTHEQYAELAFAIQQQGSLEGSLKDKSVPASPEKAANRAKEQPKTEGTPRTTPSRKGATRPASSKSQTERTQRTQLDSQEDKSRSASKKSKHCKIH